MPGVLHTKRFVGGLVLAATTITSVVALDVTVDAIDVLDRAATASTGARRVDPPPEPPPQPPVAPDQAPAYAVLELVNAERAARDLAPFAWNAWGENVAYGYPDAPSVVAGWMASVPAYAACAPFSPVSMSVHTASWSATSSSRPVMGRSSWCTSA